MESSNNYDLCVVSCYCVYCICLALFDSSIAQRFDWCLCKDVVILPVVYCVSRMLYHTYNSMHAGTFQCPIRHSAADVIGLPQKGRKVKERIRKVKAVSSLQMH